MKDTTPNEDEKEYCPHCGGIGEEWEPDKCSDCQQSHYMAGETLMCEECGDTFKPKQILEMEMKER